MEVLQAHGRPPLNKLPRQEKDTVRKEDGEHRRRRITVTKEDGEVTAEKKADGVRRQLIRGELQRKQLIRGELPAKVRRLRIRTGEVTPILMVRAKVMSILMVRARAVRASIDRPLVVLMMTNDDVTVVVVVVVIKTMTNADVGIKSADMVRKKKAKKVPPRVVKLPVEREVPKGSIVDAETAREAKVAKGTAIENESANEVMGTVQGIASANGAAETGSSVIAMVAFASTASAVATN